MQEIKGECELALTKKTNEVLTASSAVDDGVANRWFNVLCWVFILLTG